MQIHCILLILDEVGVSETQLFADIMRWMQEFHCRTGILFSLNETPKFSYPGRQVMNEYSVANDLDPFRVTMVEARHRQPRGPYGHRGLNWFGTLGSAFIEIYRRDPISGVVNQPPRIPVVANGYRVLQGDSVDVGLTMEDLFPPGGQEDIEEIRQLSISLDANLLQQFL
ncbi:hypothetical protein V1517DRAFT_324303 [Lipomyces orientalis]|uniref:Uncharacterized protein n=1 Tax=Lipomyces orientalis TaxID=1233043 RepID=A0ACC3TLV4_9ASCO